MYQCAFCLDCTLNYRIFNSITWRSYHPREEVSGPSRWNESGQWHPKLVATTNSSIFLKQNIQNKQNIRKYTEQTNIPILYYRTNNIRAESREGPATYVRSLCRSSNDKSKDKWLIIKRPEYKFFLLGETQFTKPVIYVSQQNICLMFQCKSCLSNSETICPVWWKPHR